MPNTGVLIILMTVLASHVPKINKVAAIKIGMQRASVDKLLSPLPPPGMPFETFIPSGCIQYNSYNLGHGWAVSIGFDFTGTDPANPTGMYTEPHNKVLVPPVLYRWPPRRLSLIHI